LLTAGVEARRQSAGQGVPEAQRTLARSLNIKETILGPKDRGVARTLEHLALVEQNLAATLELAERIYVINNGHIVHEGPARDIRSNRELLQRYLGV